MKRLLNKIPTTIISGTDKKVRHLSILRFENESYRVTYLENDIIINIDEFTDDGIFTDSIPVVYGKTIEETLKKLLKELNI